MKSPLEKLIAQIKSIVIPRKRKTKTKPKPKQPCNCGCGGRN